MAKKIFAPKSPHAPKVISEDVIRVFYPPFAYDKRPSEIEEAPFSLDLNPRDYSI